MNATELKYADGKGSGIWCCGKCGELQHPFCGDQRQHSKDNRERAEECCTGRDRRKFGDCTGCRKYLKACTCGRKDRHLCVTCGGKLRNGEGKKIRWGAASGEICYACQNNKALGKKLADAR